MNEEIKSEIKISWKDLIGENISVSINSPHNYGLCDGKVVRVLVINKELFLVVSRTHPGGTTVDFINTNKIQSITLSSYSNLQFLKKWGILKVKKRE